LSVDICNNNFDGLISIETDNNIINKNHMGYNSNYLSNNFTTRNSLYGEKITNNNFQNNFNNKENENHESLNDHQDKRINKRSHSMHSDIFIRSETNNTEEKQNSLRKSSTFKLNFNEDEKRPQETINMKSDYIYTILYNPTYFNKLSSNEKKEFLMRYS